MSGIQNVVILGATGLVGKEIVKALLDDGSFFITVVRRLSGNSSVSFPQSSHLREVCDVDYNSVNSLKKAFAGQHAIIEAFNPAGAVHQDTIVQAVVETESIRHIITPDFSGDHFNEHIHEIRIYDGKVKGHRAMTHLIQQRKSLHWTAILTGAFFDWAMIKGFFWMDAKARQVTIFGSGRQTLALAKTDIVGRATLCVLKNPTAYQDRQAYFADYNVSCNELLRVANDLEDHSWTAKHVSLDDLYEQGKMLWDRDTAMGVQDRRETMAYAMLGLVEPGFGWTIDQFKQELQTAIHKARKQ